MTHSQTVTQLQLNDIADDPDYRQTSEVVEVIFLFLRRVSATIIPSLQRCPIAVLGTLLAWKCPGFNLGSISP